MKKTFDSVLPQNAAYQLVYCLFSNAKGVTDFPQKQNITTTIAAHAISLINNGFIMCTLYFINIF